VKNWFQAFAFSNSQLLCRYAAAATRIQRWIRRCTAQKAAAHEEICAMLAAKRAALRAMEDKVARQEKMGKRVVGRCKLNPVDDKYS
jgi:hypothetical protein